MSLRGYVSWMLTTHEVWDLVLKNEHLLRREIRRSLPAHRRRELDDMYSDVVLERACSIMERYDASRGVLPITHLCACVRWYAYKWVHRRCYKPVPAPTELNDSSELHGCSSQADPEAIAAVNLLLESVASVDAEARLLLEWHLMKGYTFEEIATHLELTKAQVKTRYHEAVELARGVGLYRKISLWLEELLDAEISAEVAA